MLKIAVCDDTPEECRAVEEYAERFFRERRIEAEIDTYSSMTALLEAGGRYGLYLLDVLMPGMSGLQGADSLRTLEQEPVIVFITSSLEAAVEGYSVNASGFLLKPVEWTSFSKTMERVTEQKLKLEQAFLPVVHNRVPLKLSLDRIVCFENRLHRVFVTLTDGEILSIGQKLSQIQEALEGKPEFLRCHQSYIVNLEQTEGLQDSCFLMKGGVLVPISRNCYKQSKHAYYCYRLK